MALTLVVDRRDGEPDILADVQAEDLVLKDLDGRELCRCAPPGAGWTPDTLESAVAAVVAADPGITTHGTDAFVGRSWVGSTEV